jgi:uncharacterized iron-regulated membrane protein
MAYATGLRLLAALLCFTIVGLPIGALLWWKARKVEKAKEREQENLQKIAESVEES